MPEVTMQTILTDIGSFFTQSITWVGDIIDTIVAEPVLLIMVVCMPVAGFAVGYLNRLLRA